MFPKTPIVDYSKITNEILAYTAGLIDADGYIGLIKKTNKNGYVGYEPKVKLASTTDELIIFLHDNYGGHISGLRNHGGNNKPSRMWELSNARHVQPFLEAIKPYMQLKHKRADIVIDCINNAYGKKTDEARKQRRMYYNMIRKLNFRGVKQSPPTTE